MTVNIKSLSVPTLYSLSPASEVPFMQMTTWKNHVNVLNLHEEIEWKINRGVTEHKYPVVCIGICVKVIKSLLISHGSRECESN